MDRRISSRRRYTTISCIETNQLSWIDSIYKYVSTFCYYDWNKSIKCFLKNHYQKNKIQIDFNYRELTSFKNFRFKSEFVYDIKIWCGRWVGENVICMVPKWFNMDLGWRKKILRNAICMVPYLGLIVVVFNWWIS